MSLPREQTFFLDYMSDAVIIHDMDFRISFWNRAAEETYGWKPADVMGKLVYEMIPMEFEQKRPEDVLAEIRETGVWSGEITQTRKDGTKICVQATVSTARDLQGEPIGFIGVNRDITEHKQVHEQLDEYQLSLRALASELTLAEENERRRIASDLHDHIGHSLALARIQLSQIRNSKSEMETTVLVNDISNILLQSIEETKNLVFELSSPFMNEIGLSAAVSEWLDEFIERRHGLKTEMIDKSKNKPRDSSLRAILFRNIREVLTNVIKHAQANTIRVRIEDDPDVFTIVIQDDGIGCDPRDSSRMGKREGGFGLFSIRERLANFGGSLRIRSEPGKGCEVIMTIPAALCTAPEKK